MKSTASPPPPEFLVMMGHLVEATRELFAEFALPLEPCQAKDDSWKEDDGEALGMAVIGYAGTGLRGALVMQVAEPAIHAWMAAAGVPDGEAADTLGEFSNMLLGRLKERLLPVGISIIATTPTAAIGNGFRLSDSPGPSSWFTFDGPGWNLRIRLDANFEAGFHASEARPLARQTRVADLIDLDEPGTRDE
jgi:CheY-specific phosphatase CheX